MLMDRGTLLAHEIQWVREPTPTTAPLPALDPQEAALYRDLVEDALGPSVRLEQERVSYRAITGATAPSVVSLPSQPALSQQRERSRNAVPEPVEG